MFYIIGVLKNFAKIHRKTPWLKSLFNKGAVLTVFSLEICEIFKKSFVSQNNFGSYFWNKTEGKRLTGEDRIKLQ